MQDYSTVWETPTARQLAEVTAAIDSVQTMQKFLRDVMTEKEIIEISARLEAARMLADGRKYTDIIERTKLSSRTVARICNWMENGQGGYAEAIQIAEEHHSHISPVRVD